MIKIICFFCIFFYTIVTMTITPQGQNTEDNLTANIVEKAKHPEEPGAVNDILNSYEELKKVAPDRASKLSSFIDRLKNLFKSEPTQPVIAEQQTSQSTEITTPTQQPTAPESTVKQEIVVRLDQTAEAIKQAASTASKVVQEKAELLCQQLPTVDLKSAGQAAITKATEIQTACANLGTQVSASATKAKDVIVNQTAAMAEEITKELKKGKEKAEVKVQELCESVKQAASTFKEKAEDQWNKIKNSCSPFLTSEIKQPKSEKPTDPKVSTKPEGQPTRTDITPKKPEPLIAQPKTIKIAEETSSLPKSPLTKPNTNPFFNPDIQAKATESEAKKASDNTRNPFTLTENSFLSNKDLTGVEKVTVQEKNTTTPPTVTPSLPMIAIEKKPAQPKKAVEKIKESNLEKLMIQIADFSNELNNQGGKQIVLDENNRSYFVNKENISSITSLYKLYKTVSTSDQNQAKKVFVPTLQAYMNLLLKQIEYIVPLVDQALKKRINYLVLWLDIEANLACAASKEEEKTETLSLSKIGGWLSEASSAIKKQAETLKKQATAAVEAIVCSDDELLFTQKDKEWEAVTTKTHVEKMIQEYSTSIDFIQKGIAEPIFDLMNIDLKDLMPTEQLNAIKKACAPLMNVTESTVNFDKDITVPKEQFFKNNGDLTILYNLWIRYLNKYIVKKGASKWTDDQKKAFKQFNAGYFIPLHETIKQLQSISTQEETVKKMITKIDSYVKNQD